MVDICSVVCYHPDKVSVRIVNVLLSAVRICSAEEIQSVVEILCRTVREPLARRIISIGAEQFCRSRYARELVCFVE